MQSKKMLIDASHPEETRVVALTENRLEDFDVEVESRKQLKGNIYLAKVMRVEPSLQAAFVDYGGNRHGFLAFSEIHPDYYQIPVADREALVAEQEAAEKAEGEENGDTDEAAAREEGEPGAAGDDDGGRSKDVEIVGGDEQEDFEVSRARLIRSRRYKIQEVIKRRQILLIQVVKEERGTKGAALTTYISLAGRYCVLMPNTARGGGISRKISNGNDRKRLKTILKGLDLPEGMAVIVRTAGINRSKAEVKRDYEYLIRLWNTIRENTLESTAPALIHEEGNLIKRSIRDLYNNDIEEIIVAGDEGYRMAKDFMKLLIPSHAKKVQPYKNGDQSIMHFFKVEGQIDAIHSPQVQLRSGGYIVINPTEALVSIDVNSGRSTRERNIEETAIKTNLEASDEIARQLRLRDLAGLIVIDYIDMEVSRNNAKVERRLKEAMRHDRARIQLGRISPFGLLEMSRQRLRPSLLETSSEPCPYCEGTGLRRSTDSASLAVLRAIEEETAKGKSKEISIHVPGSVALYILNYKRSSLAEIEQHNEVTIYLIADDSLIPPEIRIDRGHGPEARERPKEVHGGEREESGKRRRRRRGRRHKSSEAPDTDEPVTDEAESASEEVAGEAPSEGAEEGRRGRRGRRGGRGRRPTEAKSGDNHANAPMDATDEAPAEAVEKAPRRPAGPGDIMLPGMPVSEAILAGDNQSEVDGNTAPGKIDGKVDEKKKSARKRPGGKEAGVKKAAKRPGGKEAGVKKAAKKPGGKKAGVKKAAKKPGGKEAGGKEAEQAAAAASKTTVIELGSGLATDAADDQRQGWWSR
jgi:ribonuclease E